MHERNQLQNDSLATIPGNAFSLRHTLLHLTTFLQFTRCIEMLCTKLKKILLVENY